MLGGIGLLLCAAGTAAAQSGVGIVAPAPDRLGQPPRYERLYPNDSAADAAARGVYQAPVFIGPAARTETTELGFSAWIAPYSEVGLQPGGGDLSGWASLGLTLRWGDQPRRPSRGQTAR